MLKSLQPEPFEYDNNPEILAYDPFCAIQSTLESLNYFLLNELDERLFKPMQKSLSPHLEKYIFVPVDKFLFYNPIDDLQPLWQHDFLLASIGAASDA